MGQGFDPIEWQDRGIYTKARKLLSSIAIAEPSTINIMGITTDQTFKVFSRINTVATRGGQIMAIVCHLLLHKIVSTSYKPQVRSVMDYSPFAYVNVSVIG